MFDPDLMKQINERMKLPADELAALRTRLLEIGMKFREILDVTPTTLKRGPANVNLGDRSAWVAEQVISPAQQLIEAIANRPMFSQYPERHATALSDEDLNSVSEMLGRLIAFSQDLKFDFDQRQRENAPHNQEIRFELVHDLAVAFQHVGVRLARGTYVAGGEVGGTGQMGHLIGLAVREITGGGISVDHHLKEMVKVAKKSR